MCLSWRGMCVVALVAVFAITGHCVTALVTLDDGPPGHVVANVSDAITLVCDLRDIGAGGRVRWHHRDAEHYLSYNREIDTQLPDELQARLAILGDPDQEQFNLRIRDLRQSDTGTYSCHYSSPGSRTRTLAISTLTVYVPPNPQSPECRVEPLSRGDTNYGPGDQVSLYCNSTGSPSPILTFRRGHSASDGILSSAVSNNLVLPWLLTPEDNGVDFICTMRTPALDEARYCSVRPLEIPPQVEVTPSRMTVEKGAGVSLVCRGSGEPNIASYRWAVRDTETGEDLPVDRYMIDQSTHLLEIFSVQEDVEVTCTVAIPSGLTDDSTARIEVMVVGGRPTTVSLTMDAGADANATVTASTAYSNSTQPAGMVTRNSMAGPPKEAPLPVIVIITSMLAVVATIAVLIIFVCYCCVWRKKTRKRPRAAAEEYPIVEQGNTYEEVPYTALPNKTTDTVVQMQPGASAVTTTPQYAVPKKPKRGTPKDPKNEAPVFQYATPKKRSRRGKEASQGPPPTKDKPPTAKGKPTDTALYAQPRKLSKRIKSRVKWGFDTNGYKVVRPADFRKPEPEIVYADIEFASPV